MKKIKPAKTIPFEFVLDELANLEPRTKAMFGALGVYVGPKIVLILRSKDTYPKDNGLWLATTGEHHASLQKTFPSMRSIEMFGPGPTGWQVLPEDAEDFEESALKACALIQRDDPRIGKVPKGRALRKKAKAAPKSAKKSPTKKKTKKKS